MNLSSKTLITMLFAALFFALAPLLISGKAHAQSDDPAFIEATALYDRTLHQLNAALEAAIAAPDATTRARIAERALHANVDTAERLEQMTPSPNAFDRQTELGQVFQDALETLPTDRAEVVRSHLQALRIAVDDLARQDDQPALAFMRARADAVIAAHAHTVTMRSFMMGVTPLNDIAREWHSFSFRAHEFMFTQVSAVSVLAGYSDESGSEIILHQANVLDVLERRLSSARAALDAVEIKRTRGVTSNFSTDDPETIKRKFAKVVAIAERFAPHVEAYEAIHKDMTKLHALTKAELTTGVSQEQSDQMRNLTAKLRASMTAAEALE